MTSFADREKEFEARFKHDQEFKFKITSRRNRLLGLWAAQKMGLTDADAETYVKEVLAAQFEPGGEKRVLDKIVNDLVAKGEKITAGAGPFRTRALRRAGEAAADEGIAFLPRRSGSPISAPVPSTVAALRGEDPRVPHRNACDALIQRRLLRRIRPQQKLPDR